MKSWSRVPDKDTQQSRLVRAEANSFGWREVVSGAGEEIIGEKPSPSAKSIFSLIHISDLHICDAQSPARVEILDRYADPHNPLSALVKLVGTYRANEIMTAHTLEAMVRTINNIEHGPVSDRKIDAVVVTGDVTDNAQSNELDWYLTLMDGGHVHPDSGNTTEWEGVASKDPTKYDRSYWNPEGTPDGCEDDYPRSLYGLPTIPGLTDAVRNPFQATGLRHNWFATHGNHDALLQGTVVGDDFVTAFATGDQRVVELAPDVDLAATFGNFQMVGPTSYPDGTGSKYCVIAPDQRRRINQPSDWANIHLGCGHDHGLDIENSVEGTKYWYRDLGEIRLISMDTVNQHGGWQGSLDETQFAWLKRTLNDPAPKYFILLSHHPAPTLFNDYAPEGSDRRIAEKELVDELLRHERIILWLAGHDHNHDIDLLKSEETGNSIWHIQTCSNIDWPQQGRKVEILEDGGKIVIATTVFDHQGTLGLEEATSDLNDPINLAGISRLLSANHWQRRSGEFDLELMAGTKEDRNRYLWL
jgi:metallophosphoesterase (TIGR03767 family)